MVNQITTLIGRPEAVVTIHGGMGREERKKAEEAFKQDVTVQVLIATDAAGEGINLQRAHLMVNYDLPVKAKLDQVVADRLDQSRLREPGTGQLRFIEVKGRIEGRKRLQSPKTKSWRHSINQTILSWHWCRFLRIRIFQKEMRLR
ncbi:MAG: helicase-related protein [Leptolyngbya sp. IPPAS B-1204]